MKKKPILIVYIVAIHLVILLVLFKPGSIIELYHHLNIKERPLGALDHYQEYLWREFSFRSKSLKHNAGKLIFFGDSRISRVAIESILNGVNFGITGETTRRAKVKIKGIANLHRKKIVLAFGVNDIIQRSDSILMDYKELIKQLPYNSDVYIASILPINEVNYENITGIEQINKQIDKNNLQLKEYALQHRRVHYLNTSKYFKNDQLVKAHLYDEDGLHLSSEGNKQWIEAIQAEMDEVDYSNDSALIPFNYILSKPKS